MLIHEACNIQNTLVLGNGCRWRDAVTSQAPVRSRERRGITNHREAPSKIIRFWWGRMSQRCIKMSDEHKRSDGYSLDEKKVIILSAVIVCTSFMVGLLFSYALGTFTCECDSACGHVSDFNLDGIKDSLLVTNYLTVRESEIYRLCLLVISCGVAIGLIFHGFPFRFDFRRSTVYNEYSEDDEDDEDDQSN